MPRTFVAIQVNDKIRDQLIKVQDSLKETGADLKLVKPRNIHITLRFIGEVSEDRMENINNAISKSQEIINPFKLNVSGLGVFPNTNYIRVIWAGVSNGRKSVVTLRYNIDKNLKEYSIPSEDKKFTPHLTIARVKSGKVKNKLQDVIGKMSNTDFGVCEVNHIDLMKSDLTPKGPIYTNIERFDLS